MAQWFTAKRIDELHAEASRCQYPRCMCDVDKCAKRDPTLAQSVPNRLYGVTITPEGDAI